VNLLVSERRFEPQDEYDPSDVANLAEAPFPEYLTVEDRSAEMAHHIIRWITDENCRQQTIAALQPLRETFVHPGASKRAAKYILEKLGRSTKDPLNESPEVAQRMDVDSTNREQNSTDGKAA
jgi:hypothetical protein